MSRSPAWLRSVWLPQAWRRPEQKLSESARSPPRARWQRRQHRMRLQARSQRLNAVCPNRAFPPTYAPARGTAPRARDVAPLSRARRCDRAKKGSQQQQPPRPATTKTDMPREKSSNRAGSTQGGMHTCQNQARRQSGGKARGSSSLREPQCLAHSVGLRSPLNATRTRTLKAWLLTHALDRKSSSLAAPSA